MAKKNEKCAKQCYATRRDAEAAIAGMARRWTFVYKRAYRCGQCKAWHITGTPRGRRPRRKKY